VREENKMKFTVLLKDGTVGDITLSEQHADDLIGEVVNVHSHDENGNPIEVQGELVEVLEIDF